MNVEKKLIREKCKILRANLDTDLCSKKICKKIIDWNIYKNAEHVMLFYPIGSEFSLLSLLSDSSKSFYFPCVKGDDMYCVPFDMEKGFKIGAFNINEPIGQRLTNLSSLDLIFVPALAVDKSGVRLGYGKGFYDKFLKQCKGSIAVAPISSLFIFDKIPEESHDVKLDCLISENDILWVKD